jgi:hypothetical protein
MTHPSKNSENYHTKKLEALIGSTVTAVAIDSSDEFDVYLGLELTFPNGKKKVIFFLSDEEGNHPGAYDIMNV